METKNKSEKLFEQYLDLNGFSGEWTHEQSIQGKNTKPDYLLVYKVQQCFFEVKELRKKPNEPIGAAYIDPYSSLRSEIHEVRRQFKDYKEYSCSLVVFNLDDKQVRLDPLTVFGAMLGNLGLAGDFDPKKGGVSGQTIRNVFSGDGKMINDKRRQPQNTTISAIVVLEEFLDNAEKETAMREEMRKQRRRFSGPELIRVRRELQKNHPITFVPRVVVIENPFARIAFPDDLFMGPFDERWCWSEKTGKVGRVFVGSKLKKLEILKNEA